MSNSTTSRFDGKNLAQKLAIIQGEVRYVQKTGYNAHHKYKYVKEADLVEKIAPLLAEAGIIMVPQVREVSKDGQVTTIIIDYLITDGTDKLGATVVGAGADGQDKGAYKAMTGAHKYLLYKLFNVATGDDPEEDDAVETPASKSAIVAQVAAAVGGKPFDDKELVYVRLEECQTHDDLAKIGAKVKEQFGKDKKFLLEFSDHWQAKQKEITNGQRG
jgi:ERF superfamily protein